MRKSWFAIFVATGLSACATTPPVSLNSTYNPEEVAWAQAQGNNNINGSAVLRTVGGDVKTCAGLKAMLVPVGTYSSELMEKMFGSTSSGIMRYQPNITIDPAFAGSARTTVCDPMGNFRFSGVPDGDYFVMATVTWGAVSGGRYAYIAQQGGDLMQRVSLRGGETKSVVLTA